jgi:hypothetical protein
MDVWTDERRAFTLPADELWAQISSVGQYQRWWPWLEAFDGTCFEVGETWWCTVRTPLPYRVRFSVTLDEVVPGRSVTTTIGRDLDGTAAVAIRPVGDGSEMHLTARLRPSRSLLRAVSVIAPPVARFGHDRVITAGLRQFEQHLLVDLPEM